MACFVIQLYFIFIYAINLCHKFARFANLALGNVQFGSGVSGLVRWATASLSHSHFSLSFPSLSLSLSLRSLSPLLSLSLFFLLTLLALALLSSTWMRWPLKRIICGNMQNDWPATAPCHSKPFPNAMCRGTYK